MKHAYLILAHQDFAVLAALISALDDVRNDIFIHFDRKVEVLPTLVTSHAKLNVLDQRIDVRWGDVSVVEAELLLFEKAFNSGTYTYYHLLSGVDMPLKSQDYLHDFFTLHQGKEFIGYSQGDQHKHIQRKVQRYHAFPKHFRSSGSPADLIRKSIRYLLLRLQFALHITRNREVEFKKGTQWVSLSHHFVAYMLPKKTSLLKMYRNTFCADEIAIQTLCWNSSFRAFIYDKSDEGNSSQRMIQWVDNQIYDWELADLSLLKSSNSLFARKFNSKEPALLAEILMHIKKP